MTDRELFERACRAMDFAYVPYSRFKVGACLLSEDGRAFSGCNVENASYGATLCAERTALVKGVSEGARKFTAVAVVGEEDDAWPCGICRQVLSEFSRDMRVICGARATGNSPWFRFPSCCPARSGPRIYSKEPNASTGGQPFELSFRLCRDPGPPQRGQVLDHEPLRR
jgi:cytidine deaminase